MLVRMKTNITGSRDGVPWPAVGETIDVPDAEAESLVANDYAEPADATEEIANAPDPEPTPESTADSDGEPAAEVSDATVKAAPVRRPRARKAASK